MSKELTIVDQIKVTLASEYQHQIINYFGDQKKALKFLSGVVASMQRTPKLQECTPVSLINSFMIMAQFEFMPSAISGEAYVLPYKNKKGVMEAQFQLGYQGIITLLYKAGAKSVVSEVVRLKDEFKIVNASMTHSVNPLMTRKERGKQIGAYAIITLQTGGTIEKFMRSEEILAFGKRFSKSFGSNFSPWNVKNDPEAWMWRKTVLKQASKLAPKNETLNRAMSYDNEDSVLSDRIRKDKKASTGLRMGELMVKKEPKVEEQKETIKKNVKEENKEGKGKVDEETTTENNAPGAGAV